MYIYIEKTDGQIVRVNVPKNRLDEARYYAEELKKYPGIKFVFFDV